MSSWVNRTVLSGSSTAANGTTSHTCTFTAATSGNLLVAVMAGSITFSTPSGWTLRQSAVNFSGLYLFTKSASAAESSFSTTHNSSNFAILGVVYEFAAGSSYLAGNSATGQAKGSTVTGPQVTSLSGTYSSFGARSVCMDAAATTGTCAWTLPSVRDYDVNVLRSAQDGICLSIALDDNQTGSSFNPSSVLTNNSALTGEGIAFALSVTAPASTIPLGWTQGING